MKRHSFSQLVRYKQWADRGLYDVIRKNLDRMDQQDLAVVMLILDHMHVVDSIFQNHLQGRSHGFHAPRSEALPEFKMLSEKAMATDEWYRSYVDNLDEQDFERAVDFVFTSGKPARMKRGEIIMHVCLHGTYHRGNAGVLLQKNGVTPNDDRMTDFLEIAA
jgi:uncharacterized damage-inducible protein DinB